MTTMERHRQVGDKVRVTKDAYGQRTGTAVCNRYGTVVDRLPREPDGSGRDTYYVRFHIGARTLFFDWVLGSSLVDY